MELDRDSIVRKDFKRAVRGYDPWEVEGHLREVNRELSLLMDQLAKGEGDIPQPISYRIQAHAMIVELEATETLQAARAEAERAVGEA